MNIVILWLLSMGQLVTLQQGWMSTQKIDPLTDYIKYQIRSWAFLLVSLVTSWFTAIGFGVTLSHFLKEFPEVWANIDPKECPEILTLCASLGVFIFTFNFFCSYKRMRKKEWWKSWQFQEDVEFVADRLYPCTGSRFSRRLSALAGNKQIREGFRACMVSLACRILRDIRDEDRSTTMDRPDKRELQEYFEVGRRLGLFKEGSLRPFYLAATRRLESEKN